MWTQFSPYAKIPTKRQHAIVTSPTPPPTTTMIALSSSLSSGSSSTTNVIAPDKDSDQCLYMGKWILLTVCSRFEDSDVDVCEARMGEYPCSKTEAGQCMCTTREDIDLDNKCTVKRGWGRYN